jgi:branched-subunit amino acid transport protein
MSNGLVIVGMALVNLVIRCPLFLLARRVHMPALIKRALSYTPVAVLTAFIVPSALHLDLAPDGSQLLNPDLIAAIAAALVSWFTGRLMLTIGVGMALAMGLRLLV